MNRSAWAVGIATHGSDAPFRVQDDAPMIRMPVELVIVSAASYSSMSSELALSGRLTTTPDITVRLLVSTPAVVLDVAISTWNSYESRASRALVAALNARDPSGTPSLDTGAVASDVAVGAGVAVSPGASVGAADAEPPHAAAINAAPMARIRNLPDFDREPPILNPL